MGSQLIWIAASFAYGAVSAAIYALVCWRTGRRRIARRTLISFGAYSLFGLVVTRILWIFLGI